MKTNKRVIALGFIDNLLSAMRTAGALLAGNSALVYFEVIGGQSANFVAIAFFGVTCALFGSIPAERIYNYFLE
jgi:hypothetical protein